MADTIIYEGPVKLYTTNRDGSPLTYTPKKGNNAGIPQPYTKVAFSPDGSSSTIYLADFTYMTAAIADNAVCQVAYEQVYLPAADAFSPPQPKLYNGEPQYKLTGIRQLQQPQLGTQTPARQAEEPRITTSVLQTCVNAGVALTSAMIAAGAFDASSADVVGMALESAERVRHYFETGSTNELDAALAQPPAQAKPEEPEEEPDDDIPF